MPLVSVITPVFNAARWLPETLASVKAQTLTDWEHILVDDVSTDDSVAVVERAAKEDARVRLFHMPNNGGPAGARNLALSVARGRFIAILDADDLWDTEKLAHCVAFMISRGHAFIYHDSRIISDSGTVVGAVFGPDELNMHTLHTRRGIRTCAVMVDQEQIPDLCFPQDSLHEDFLAWLTLVQHGHVGHRFAEVLSSYRLATGSRNSKKLRSAVHCWSNYRNVSGLSLTRATNWWIQYAWNSWSSRRASGPSVAVKS